MLEYDTQRLDDLTTEYLDRIIPGNLTSFIREFQASVPVGSTAMLGFTARGRLFPSSKNDNLYDLAALPFIFRQHLAASARTSSSGSVPNVPRSALRTMIPLKTTLDNIIFLLTSGSTPFTIKSVQNVSDEYTTHLDEHADRLFTDTQAWTKFQQTWGTEGWREERILAVWEAALVRAEVFTRWAVVVERRV